LPIGGDVKAATERLTTVKVHPLNPGPDWQDPSWIDLTGKPVQLSLLGWESNLEFWRALHEVIDSEPHLDEFRILYGELAALGIARGRPFAPDERTSRILEEAALRGNA
jgi:hypothetical protein